jgi:hypothetical protein
MSNTYESTDSDDQEPRHDPWSHGMTLPSAVARLSGQRVEVKGGHSHYVGRVAVDVDDQGRIRLGDHLLPDERRRRLWRLYRTVYGWLHWRIARRRRRAPVTGVLVPVPELHAHVDFLDREREWALGMQARDQLRIVEPPTAHGQPWLAEFTGTDGTPERAQLRFPTYKALIAAQKEAQ